MIEPVFARPFYPHPVLTVRCPWCFAKPGRGCFSKFGAKSTREEQARSVRVLPHNSRMKAAGARWPEPPIPTGTGWV